MPELSAEALAVTFKDADGRPFKVLDRLDFAPARGRLTAVVGASGSGKLTLLNALSGLIRPHAGRIIFDATDISKLGEARRDRWRRDHPAPSQAPRRLPANRFRMIGQWAPTSRSGTVAARNGSAVATTTMLAHRLLYDDGLEGRKTERPQQERQNGIRLRPSRSGLQACRQQPPLPTLPLTGEQSKSETCANRRLRGHT